jgi:hypothetical protein
MSARQYSETIDELINAYFTEFSIFYLTNAFDKVVTDLWTNKLLVKSDAENHPSELTKIVLALLLTILVEHGQLSDYRRYIGQGGQITGTICDIANFPEYCPKLGQSNDYRKWTHLILYLISILRANLMFDLYHPNRSPYILDVNGTSSHFVSNVILLLYAFLFIRLILAASNLPGESVRFNIEACMFSAILSFYYDYTQYTRLDTKANIFYWETLKKQVVNMYLDKGRFFMTLKLSYPFNSYLHEDIIGNAYSCILKAYIDAYKNSIPAASQPLLLSTSTITYPDPENAIKCLHNLDLNSLSIIGNRWFRRLVNNKLVKGFKSTASGIVWAGQQIWGVGINTYEGIRDAYAFSHGVYSLLYNNNWPRISGTVAVTVGLVAFASKTSLSLMKTQLKMEWKLLTAAMVYAFRKDELLLNRPMASLRIEKPGRPAYLRWDRSPDGKYNPIYNVSPLPGIPIPIGSNFPFIQRGGAGRNTKNMEDLSMLAHAFNKKYIKRELPPEIAAVIRRKLQFTTKMKGGGINQWDGVDNFEIAPRLDADDILPDGWTSFIIDNAEMDNYLREDEDGETMQLVLIKPPLEKVAIEEAVYVVELEPDDEPIVPPSQIKELPDTVPETDPSKPIPILEKVTVVKMEAPPTPVDPIVSLPTIPIEKKEEILASTSVPPRKDAEQTIIEANVTGVQPMLSSELNTVALTIPVKRTFTVRYGRPSRPKRKQKRTSYQQRRSSSRRRTYRRRHSTRSRNGRHRRSPSRKQRYSRH